MPEDKVFNITKKLERTILTGGVLILILIAILFISLGYGDWILENHSNNYERAAQYGDMHGGLNALFSGFAFFGVVVTLLFQSWQLKLQRTELEKALEQYTRTANAQQGMEELQKQTLEATRDAAEAQKDLAQMQKSLITSSQGSTAAQARQANTVAETAKLEQELQLLDYYKSVAEGNNPSIIKSVFDSDNINFSDKTYVRNRYNIQALQVEFLFAQRMGDYQLMFKIVLAHEKLAGCDPRGYEATEAEMRGRVAEKLDEIDNNAEQL